MTVPSSNLHLQECTLTQLNPAQLQINCNNKNITAAKYVKLAILVM